MSRKRDTNWSRDEITVLLDSIMEITNLRANDGRRTNSKEVFEYAAKKMGEKGHSSRAEREKCRTKWKKMKEEFTHAKKAREGDARFKEAPGIQPFYDRMREFINGNFDNISPHSTIVRRTSSLSSRLSPEKRASARIAANTTTTTTTTTTNGSSPNDNTDTTSSTIVTRANTTSNDYPLAANTNTTNNNNTTTTINTIKHTASNQSPSSRLNSRLSSGSNNNSNTNTTNSSTNSSSSNAISAATTSSPTSQQPPERTPLPNGELSIYTAYANNKYPNSISTSTTGSNLNSAGNDLISASPPEHADISYRVSTGCRQITIFGDHDVDIKFRGDCVTINKIDVDYQNTELLRGER